jgi:hypothetical protein
MLVHGMVMMAIVFGVVIPFLTVKWGWENHRLWRRLRRQGRVARWADIEPQVVAGSGTLLVAVGPKGPGCAWLIDRPRPAIDPEAIVPTWEAYESLGLEVFEGQQGRERLAEWASAQLQPFEATARVLVPSRSQLANLSPDAKRGAVLVTFGWERGFAEPGAAPDPARKAGPGR